MTQIKVQQLGALLRQQQSNCAVAESCTGGLLAAAITDVAGSSQWFERGVVTYSNQAKEDLLDVPHALIQEQGAVSEAVVLAMAKGLLQRSPVQWTVAITGVAGPSGGSDDKPVGTVWFAWAESGGVAQAQRAWFSGDRQTVRQQAVTLALDGLIARLSSVRAT